MGRRIRPAGAALVVLVVLAGCSGGSAPSGPSMPTGPTPTGSDAAPTGPTATPADSASVTEVVEEHVRTLRERGNYTAVTTVNVTTENSTDFRVTTRTYVNLVTDRLYQNGSFVTSGGRQRTFRTYKPGNESVSYERRTSSGEVTYRSQSFDPSTFANHTSVVDGVYGNVSALPEFQDRGIVQTEVGKRRMFVVENVSALTPSVKREFARNGRITVVHLEMLVDPETGVVTDHYVHFLIESQRGQREITIYTRYTDVGTTVVPTPDWVDEARERT